MKRADFLKTIGGVLTGAALGIVGGCKASKAEPVASEPLVAVPVPHAELANAAYERHRQRHRQGMASIASMTLVDYAARSDDPMVRSMAQSIVNARSKHIHDFDPLSRYCSCGISLLEYADSYPTGTAAYDELQRRVRLFYPAPNY